jgi:hypothetical protein
MKRFVLAIALTGLISMTVLAGEVPINGVAATPPPASTTVLAGEVPTNGVGATPPPTTTSSTLLTNVVLTIITLIGR